jgi:hypothetical protein
MKNGRSNPKPAVADPPVQESLADLLQRWRGGDAEEQRGTLEYLMRALDQDRLSGRKLFE